MFCAIQGVKETQLKKAGIYVCCFAFYTTTLSVVQATFPSLQKNLTVF